MEFTHFISFSSVVKQLPTETEDKRAKNERKEAEEAMSILNML